jgi:enoyl-CoA hydratase
MSDSPLVKEISGPIAIVRFNQPHQRNALSSRILDNLDLVLSELLADQRVQAIIFTGTGDVFLSGADIRELAQLDQARAHAFSQRGQRLMQRIAEAKPLTIAAVNGFCMGGGLDFALACDVRIGSTTAVFAHPGARLGIITGWGGTQRLPRLIGPAGAIQLFATARRMNSREALKIGLITEICDPVLAGATALATRVVATS